MKILITLMMTLTYAARLVAQDHTLIKEGHRGCRGLMPENTIAAMKKALDLGVQVLELDVVISKDKQVVVSHDQYMSAEISLKPSGDTISQSEEKELLLYRMNYAEIKMYDVGLGDNKTLS